MTNFTREVKFKAAYDKRSSVPGKNYGIHGVDMTWILKGPEGAIQFITFTGWHLPHVQAELESKRYDHLLCTPTGADVGYHSSKPRYEGQTPVSEVCTLTGGVCYYDGSGLAGQEMLDLLIREGDEAVWKELEGWYRRTFEESPSGGK